MKKFSKLTNQKIGEEPKVEHKIDESKVIKNKMMNLMDRFLSVTTYGPIDRYQRAGLIKISGKEMLAEAISDMLIDLSNKDKKELLESLRYDVRDWSLIDDKIDSLDDRRASIINKNKMCKLLEMYAQDEDMLISIIENKSSKINNLETLLDYKLIISENNDLSNKTKSILTDIYSERISKIK